jgi:hypothetical protein
MARDLLKRGYELARQGRCAEAVPMFEKSFELDRTPKTALNLARCEEESLRFADALRHWVQARDLAREWGAGAVAREAEMRLSALEQKMPQVRIVLDAAAPPGTVVLRDGVKVPAEALGHPMPVDPGPHRIDVAAKGYWPRRFTFEADVGGSHEVHVAVGEAEGGDAATTAATAPLATMPPATPSVGMTKGPSSNRKDPAKQGLSPREYAARPYVYGGLGVAGAGLVVGTVTGILTLTEASAARSQCPNDVCTADGFAQAESARALGTVSTVSFIVAGTGAALALTSYFIGKSGAADARVREPSPSRAATVGVGPGGFMLRGTF